MSVIQPTAMNQGDLFNLLQALVNRVFGNPGLVVAGTTTAVKVANAVSFSIAGRLYSKAIEDNIVVSGLTNTGVGQFRKVRIEINTSGTVSFREGGVGAAQVSAPMPRRSQDKATLGWFEVPASFTWGTSNTNDSGCAFYNGDPDLGSGAGVPPNDRGIAATILNG